MQQTQEQFVVLHRLKRLLLVLYLLASLQVVPLVEMTEKIGTFLYSLNSYNACFSVDGITKPVRD